MKSAEIKELSLADLNEKIDELGTQLNKLKLAHAVTPLENPLQLRANRKVIARLQTELTARKVAEASKAQVVDR